MKLRVIIPVFFLVLLTGPLITLISGNAKLGGDWRSANRESSNIAPKPNITKEAVIQFYAARAFSWRGMFAVHTWFALKQNNAKKYTVYQIIGWRQFQGKPVLEINKDTPDRLWFDAKPSIILDIRGKKAEELIPKIEKIVKQYPYKNTYYRWPGPNSNTFTAFIGRKIPELKLNLPGNALGKDFTGLSIISKAPSGTGYQISFAGLFGILIAKEEGLEINILGLVFGINPFYLTAKLPGIR